MPGSNPDDEQIERNIANLRQMYAEGVLRKWQIDRLERIPGWSWSLESSENPNRCISE